MAFDAITMKALVCELGENIIDGRIDKIHQPERDEIVLHIRTREDNFRLVLSASAAHPRIHFTKYSKKNPVSAPMFCMLLRKHMGSGKITGIEQCGFERILKISVESYNELGDLTTKYLIVEIMGRHSNIILTDEKFKIIDSIKHIDFTISSVRQVLPGVEYIFPPLQNKTALTDIDTQTELEFSPIKTVDKIILDNVSGISPLCAREISYNIFGRCDINGSELNLNKQSALKAYIVNFAKDVCNNNFMPCIIKDVSSGKMLDFSPVPIKQYEGMAQIVYTSSMNEALDEFYYLRDSHERMRQKSADLVKHLNNNIERVSKKIGILEKTLKDAENKDTYKIKGDLIIANIYRIKDGQKEIEVENFYESSAPLVKISLDESLSASANAQKYFKKYNKLKTAEIEAKKQLEGARADLEYLESTLVAVENAESESDLSQIRVELTYENFLNRKQDKKKKQQSQSKPMYYKSSDGFDIYVGKNNTQNDILTLKFANSGDMWFHTKNIHGSHVIIKLGIDKDIPKATMLEAACLAAYYSKARNSSQVPVDYTQVKNVKKPNGAKPGMVIYNSYNTVYVTPKKPNVE